MFLGKANLPLFSLRLFLLAMTCSLFNSAVAMGQEELFPMPDFPPWVCDDYVWSSYNMAIPIDVLMNDYAGTNAIDVSSLTIVSGPTSGTATVDPLLGLITYTPDTNFSGFDQIQYTVSDIYGNFCETPATVDINVYNMEPSITLSSYMAGGDTWVFFGTVWDENPGNCLVTFGGLLQGETAYTDENGQFILSVPLASGQQGEVTAYATDELGKISPVESTYVYPY